PNGVQPGWFVEGLATLEETDRTSGGRLRSSFFDMYLRMHFLLGRELALDDISNDVLVWPHGNIRYLYGAYFLKYIADHYGRDALTAISHAYGRQPVSFAVNRVARRATGRTFVELYDEFLAERRRHYAASAARLRET